MKTEVKLDGTYYKLMRLPSQTLANQMASKVGQGTSEYADLTTWSAWIQEDWQEGVGKLKPHRGGGFLYGEVESRAPGQLILPQRMSIFSRDASPGQNTGYYNPPTTAYDTIVGYLGNERVAIRTHLNSTLGFDALYFYFYASIPAGVGVTIRLYDTSGGSTIAGQILTTNYYSPETNSGWYWHGLKIDIAALTIGANNYAISVEPMVAAEAFQWATGPGDNAVGGALYNNEAWVNMPLTGSFMNSPFFFVTNNPLTASLTLAGSGSGFFRFNNTLYAYAGNEVWKFNGVYWLAAPNDAGNAITGVAAVTGATIFDDKTYFGNSGGDGNYTTMSSAEVFAHMSGDGTIFTKFKGQLWRAYLNYVEYSDDGLVWEPTFTFGEPIYVTDASDRVTGLCGMGDKMYAATTAGLVPIHPGDIAVGGLTWGSLHPQNGMRMIEFEGALYIVVNGRITRYTEDGATQDIWMTRDDDVLAGRIGKVWDLEKVNNWLFAIVEATAVGGKPTIWAYQNNAWHHIATLPPAASTQAGIVSDFDIFYDRTTNKLWAITPDQLTYSWYIPDYALNPYNDPDSRYMRTAWVEWDWFNGTIMEADKDWESVTVQGENFSDTCYVEVYWQDNESHGWELLGIAKQDHQELRWTLPSLTRPNSQHIKLGLLFVTYDATQTPRLRAFRVKYHLMVRDWFRWALQIDVSGRQEAFQLLADGKRNLLTAHEIKEKLDSLCKQVPPFVYQDVDGTQYEVKCTDASFTYTKWEYNESTQVAWWEGVYNLTLEQITQGAYVP